MDEHDRRKLALLCALREAVLKSGLDYSEVARILEQFRDEIAEAIYLQAVGKL